MGKSCCQTPEPDQSAHNNPRCQWFRPIGRRLEQGRRFRCGFDLPLPAVNRMRVAQDVDAGGEPLFHHLPPDALSLGPVGEGRVAGDDAAPRMRPSRFATPTTAMTSSAAPARWATPSPSSTTVTLLPTPNPNWTSVQPTPPTPLPP